MKEMTKFADKYFKIAIKNNMNAKFQETVYRNKHTYSKVYMKTQTI